MLESPSVIWETIRRALGRLVSTTRVRSVPPEWALPSTTAQFLAGPDCPAGLSEKDWMPLSRVLQYAALQAEPGGGGADLSGVAVAISSDGAMPGGLAAVHACPTIDVDVLTHRQEVLDPRAAAVGIRHEPVAVVGGTARGAPMHLERARVSRLPTTPPVIPGRLAGVSEGRLTLAARIKSQISVGVEAPMTRSRRPAPVGSRFAEAFQAERRELARASGLALEDVTIIGVYPQVPIAAVARLGLEEDGSELALWLKPEALVAAAHGKAPRLSTLIVGRQRSTGRMIQAIG